MFLRIFISITQLTMTSYFDKINKKIDEINKNDIDHDHMAEDYFLDRIYVEYPNYKSFVKHMAEGYDLIAIYKRSKNKIKSIDDLSSIMDVIVSVFGVDWSEIGRYRSANISGTHEFFFEIFVRDVIVNTKSLKRSVKKMVVEKQLGSRYCEYLNAFYSNLRKEKKNAFFNVDPF